VDDLPDVIKEMNKKEKKKKPKAVEKDFQCEGDA
jgi:hypothetical protein